MVAHEDLAGDADALVLKLLCVGAPAAGKTLLCRMLAGQEGWEAHSTDSQPTAALRIQQLSRTIHGQAVTVQLWDVAGGPQHAALWPAMTAGGPLDGVLLVLDANRAAAEQGSEQELERLYRQWAQPHSLTIKQCCVLAVARDAPAARSWPGLRGKLSKLPTGVVCLPSGGHTAADSRQAALVLLDRQLEGCIAQKQQQARAELG